MLSPSPRPDAAAIFSLSTSVFPSTVRVLTEKSGVFKMIITALNSINKRKNAPKSLRFALSLFLRFLTRNLFSFSRFSSSSRYFFNSASEYLLLSPLKSSLPFLYPLRAILNFRQTPRSLSRYSRSFLFRSFRLPKVRQP